MIKTFLIVVLAVALMAAGFLTRPSERSALAFLKGGGQPSADAPKPLAVAVKDALIKSAAADPAESPLPDGYEFKDRVLWTEVVKDGRTVYTGVLSHWIKHDPPAAPPGKTDAPSSLAQVFRVR